MFAFELLAAALLILAVLTGLVAAVTAIRDADFSALIGEADAEKKRRKAYNRLVMHSPRYVDSSHKFTASNRDFVFGTSLR